MKFLTKLIFLLLVATTLVSCVEDFEFDGISKREGIVVEGLISNQSYNDLLALPLSTRHFTIKISNVGEVENERNEPVLGAKIELHQDNGVVYDYAEIGNGEYGLFYENFKAEKGRNYHLEITLADGRSITSEMQTLPREMGIGSFSTVEQTKLDYENVLGEVGIAEQEGISFNVTTLTNDSSDPVYYKWDLSITWIFSADLLEDNHPLKFCWATSQNYFKEYQLLKDEDGNIRNELFFLKTRNSRLNHGFSVLVRQMTMSPGYHFFWSEVQKQLDQSELFASPPYNIRSNLSSDDVAVYGYFGVVNEDFKRWYFDKSKINNYGGWVDDHCEFGPRWAAYCFDCREWTYDDDQVTPYAPKWWDLLFFDIRP
ncbi:MAG: DUF4249 domain-containing protein [Reichenbachiella sp.]|uniref:DUF4249 domain-containing protein n=1 Tax=Reichenbachiella sp. TaxID=2184521 RepID=UPI0032991744